MWFVVPYENVRRIKYVGIHCIKGVDDSIQPGCQVGLAIGFDFPDRLNATKIDKCVNQGWKVVVDPFPLDHREIIPGFSVEIRMGAVLIPIPIGEGCKAWE